MSTVHIIFKLTVQSSYLRNVEADASEDVFDTVQFFATNERAWRIKTYATDQDVHVWSIAGTCESIIPLAQRNTETHYGDVLSKRYIIKSADGIGGLRRGLNKSGLSDHFEVSKLGFLFWAPAGTSYRSRSRPRDEP
jgi:hypothetical protein